MKQAYILLLAAVVASCGNNDHHATGHGADSSAQHSGHAMQNNADAGATADSSSMHALMQKNMREMIAVPSSGNADVDFASIMRVHHQGAVEMAQTQLQNGQDQELKQLAQKIITEQQKEIAQFDLFITSLDTTKASSDNRFYQQVMSNMDHSGMGAQGNTSVDQQFAAMMIPHHQGAIDMVNTYLKSGANDQKLKAMAKKIVSDQQREIYQLQEWLKKNEVK